VEKEKVKEIIERFRINESDTGSAEVQAALFTERVSCLTEHLRKYPQDRYSRHALLKVLGKQRSLLSYLKRTKTDSYQSIAAELGLGK
jgi:small subunit ribosomal protein S15